MVKWFLTRVPRQFNGESTFVSTTSARKLGIHMQKNEAGCLPYSISKITSKWIKDLNVKPKSIKILNENIGGNLYNVGFGNDLLDMTPKAQATKVRNR